MLRTDKPIYKAILALNLLLIVVGVASCILLFAKTTDIVAISTLIMTIAVLLFGGFYILNGYRKDAAKYYKIFGLILAVKYITVLIHSISTGASWITNALHTITLVIVLVLVLSSNLGKNKSFILCGVLVVIRIACLVRWATMTPQTSYDFILNHAADIDLVCLYGILTYAKYLDKTERGTK